MAYDTMSRHGSGSIMRVPLQSKSVPRKTHFKCAVVGDSKCGKTSLLRSYTTQLVFPYTVQSSRPLPSQYPVKQELMGKEYTATITDTDSTNLENRTAAYSRADVIILCFSLVDQSSFKNIQTKWLKELEHYCSNTPIILVGTQSDLVHSCTVKRKNVVTLHQIQKLLRCPQIHHYCESSAFTKDGLPTVFFEAFHAAWVGPVRYVMRMKTVRESSIGKLKGFLLPCLFNRHKC